MVSKFLIFLKGESSKSAVSSLTNLVLQNSGNDFKGMLRRNIKHFLKKHKYENLGFSEMN